MRTKKDGPFSDIQLHDQWDKLFPSLPRLPEIPADNSSISETPCVLDDFWSFMAINEDTLFHFLPSETQSSMPFPVLTRNILNLGLSGSRLYPRCYPKKSATSATSSLKSGRFYLTYFEKSGKLIENAFNLSELPPERCPVIDLTREIPEDNDNPEKVGDNKMDHAKSRQTSI